MKRADAQEKAKAFAAGDEYESLPFTMCWVERYEDQLEIIVGEHSKRDLAGKKISDLWNST